MQVVYEGNVLKEVKRMLLEFNEYGNWSIRDGGSCDATIKGFRPLLPEDFKLWATGRCHRYRLLYHNPTNQYWWLNPTLLTLIAPYQLFPAPPQTKRQLQLRRARENRFAMTKFPCPPPKEEHPLGPEWFKGGLLPGFTERTNFIPGTFVPRSSWALDPAGNPYEPDVWNLLPESLRRVHTAMWQRRQDYKLAKKLMSPFRRWMKRKKYNADCYRRRKEKALK